MKQGIFLKRGLYYVLCCGFAIIAGQGIFLVTAEANGHPVFELKQNSSWLSVMNVPASDRLITLFLYQPFLFAGLMVIYLGLRCCRFFGYNQVFFAFAGGLLNTALVLFLLFWISFRAHAELSSLTIIVTVLLGFLSGFFCAPYFLREGLRAEKKSPVEMAPAT